MVDHCRLQDPTGITGTNEWITCGKDREVIISANSPQLGCCCYCFYYFLSWLSSWRRSFEDFLLAFPIIIAFNLQCQIGRNQCGVLPTAIKCIPIIYLGTGQITTVGGGGVDSTGPVHPLWAGLWLADLQSPHSNKETIVALGIPEYWCQFRLCVQQSSEGLDLSFPPGTVTCDYSSRYFEGRTKDISTEYTWHCVAESFITDTWPLLQSLGSGPEKWFSSDNGAGDCSFFVRLPTIGLLIIRAWFVLSAHIKQHPCQLPIYLASRVTVFF